MDPAALTLYMHRRIPLTVAMGLQVTEVSATTLAVRAPLQPNTNHCDTMFGGTLAAMALASGFLLLHARLREAELEATIVGQKSEIEYLAPATCDCLATSSCEPDRIDHFIQTVWQRGLARIEIGTRIFAGDLEVARHKGVFVGATESRRKMGAS